MASLIDDILELSRINRGTFEKSEVNLTDLVKWAIADLEPDPDEFDAEFIIQDNVNVYGDEALLQVMIDNLIFNAWKYSGKNHYIEIEFGAKELKGEKVYFIKDNGIGFDMAYYDKLFSPFQRLVNNGDFPGTGIGLATVARVIQRHNGRIWAESQPGQGATFYFTLPENNAIT
jgi:signal transduction histidine kinase